MTIAENYTILMDAARSTAEYDRALATAFNLSISQEYIGDKLTDLIFSDGSTLQLDK